MTTVKGPELRQRICHVTVGTLLLEGTDGTGLDCEFKVRKSLKPEPNTCELSIYNLNPTHRKQLIATTPQVSAASPPGTGGVVVPVKIEAGYKNTVSQVWLGELRSAQTTKDNDGNQVTELTTGDGDKAVSRQRINVSIGPGTTSATALRTMLKALGIGQGNLPKALTLLNTQGIAQIYAKGANLKGLAADHMKDLMGSAGLEWSIQEGQLQVLTLGQPLAGRAIEISAASGMVGSPTVDTKGILSVSTLMVAGIRPGIVVNVDSESLSGGYRVISCEYEGKTFGEDSPWYVHIEAPRF
jgi:hypothetical protein